MDKTSMAIILFGLEFTAVLVPITFAIWGLTKLFMREEDEE
jgi:hypothetical protein